MFFWWELCNLQLGNLLRQIWIESCKLRRANCQSILEHCTATLQSSYQKNIRFDCKWIPANFMLVVKPTETSISPRCILPWHKLYSLCFRNPVDSPAEAVKVSKTTGWRRLYISALLASGFRQVPSNHPSFDAFLPCPLGTFSNSSSKGKQGCIECPPGTFMQAS